MTDGEGGEERVWEIQEGAKEEEESIGEGERERVGE